MALVLKDRVRESSTSSGTGSITLAGAYTGYQTFDSVIASGSTVYYTIHNTTSPNDNEWEVGVGTFTSPSTLSRDTVFSSSAGGTTKVSFSGSSTLEVFITQPAEQAVYVNEATGKVEIFGNGTNTVAFTNVTADLFTGNASAVSNINASNVSSGTLTVQYGGTGLANLTAENVILGNGASAVKFVAPGSSGNVLTSTGTTWDSVAPASEFASGTRLIFAQTTAPTGWTKDTVNYNNHALRVVTGSASTGGTVDFTTAFASQTPSGTISVSTTVANTTATNQNTTATGTIAVTTTTANATATNQNTTAGGSISVTTTTANTTATGTISTSTSIANTTATGTISTSTSVANTIATNQATTAGGSVSISAISGSAGATTLATSQIPSHTHRVQLSYVGIYGDGGPGQGGSYNAYGAKGQVDVVEGTGGGGSHTHPFSFSSGTASFTGTSHNHTQDTHGHTATSSSTFTGTAHNHTATSTSTFTGTAHNHTASSSGTFTGTAHTHTQDPHNHTATSSGTFTGSAHTHTQDPHAHTATSSGTFTGNAINLAVKYLDVITATKD